MEIDESLIPVDYAKESKQLPNDHDVNVSNMPSDYAKESKQLADNHQVIVSNLADTPLVDISSLATETTVNDIKTNQTSGGAKSQIVDLDGHIANVQAVTGTIAGDEYGVVTNAIIHGKTAQGEWKDVKVNGSGALTVSVGEVNGVTLPLPTGASTSANQTTIIGHIDGIEGALTTLNAKDYATQTTLSALNNKVTAVNTGAVVISSSALPTGASTSANQTSIIGYVDQIEGYVDGIESAMTTLNAKDFSTSAKQDANTLAVKGLVDIDYTFNRNADSSIASVVMTDGTKTNTMTFNRNADGTIASISSTVV